MLSDAGYARQTRECAEPANAGRPRKRYVEPSSRVDLGTWGRNGGNME